MNKISIIGIVGIVLIILGLGLSSTDTLEVQQYSTAAISDYTNSNLVGYWKLDGNTLDSSVNDNDGTNEGATITTGKFKEAYEFNGASDYISLDNIDILGGASEFTISAYAKVDSLSKDQRLLSKGSGGTPYVLWMDADGAGKGWAFSLGTSDGYDVFGTELDTATTEWQFVAVTYNSTKLIIYVDGELTGSYDKTGTVNSDLNPASIGRLISSGQFFDGSIDEVRVYDVALSQEEILELYNQSLTSDKLLLKGSADEVVSDNLVGYWKLDGNALDSSSNDNNGIINGDTSNTTGKFNGAYTFDGTGDSVRIPYDSTLNITENITYSAWIKLDSLTGSGTIVNLFLADRMWVNDDELCFTLYVAFDQCTSSENLQKDKWYHVATTYDKQNVKFYIDGELVQTSPHTNDFTGKLTDSYIGVYATYYFNGTIDEVRIYNESLSADEISQLYNTSKDSKKFSLVGSADEGLDEGLVGHWDFDGNALDSSGNNNDGTLIDSPSLVTSKFKEAYEFNGSNYINVDNSASLQIRGNVTYSFWAKTADEDNTGRGVINKKIWYNDPDGYRIYLYPTSDQILYDFGNGTRYEAHYSDAIPGGINIGEWAYYTVVHNDTLVSFYHNGVFISSEQCGSNIDIDSTPLYIGTGYSLENYFTGSIDEVRLYNKPLTSDEVAQLYDESLSTKRFSIMGNPAIN